MALQKAQAVGEPHPYLMPVLSLRYFPLEPFTTNLDPQITGISDEWAAVNTKVNNLQDQTVSSLEAGSTYHGYKTPSNTPSLDYYILENRTFFEALPIGPIYKPGEQVYRPDYRTILQSLNICNYVDNLGVKEVWLWGYHTGPGIGESVPPYIEPTESNMSMGYVSQSYWNRGSYGDVSNSEEIDDMPTCQNTYLLYNYNYDRGLGEVMEDHGHQMEAIYNFVDSSLFWFNFVDPYGDSTQTNHCGWTHEPPNSRWPQTDYDPAYAYDWRNTASMGSNCEDWHPDGTGQVKQISCYTWPPYTCPSDPSDGGAAFKKWWMQNIPGYQNGLTFQGANLRNWWDFIGNFDAAIAKGKSLTAPTPALISVSPSLRNYGDVNVGNSSSQTFTVSNVGGGTLSGSVTFPVAPFVCLSDCAPSYNLGAGQSRNYAIEFRPTSAGTFTGTMTFSGGGGATISLSGSGVASDVTPPVSSITSPAASSWQNDDFNKDGIKDDKYFKVTISDSDSGGSGLPYCEYKIQSVPGMWVTTRDWTERLCDSSINIIVGSDCSFQGENTCRVNVQSRDGAGLWSPTASRDFSIDRTAPNTPWIGSPAAYSVWSTNFPVSVSGDGDAGGSGNNCYYHIYDSGAGWTKFRQPRNCNSSFQATVSATGDCQTDGGTCTTYVLAKDGAGNEGFYSTRDFNIDLTPPLPVCPAPENLWSVGQTADSVTIAWASVAGVKNYRLRWWQSGSFDALGAGEAVSSDWANTAVARGLSPGTSYTFDVRAETDNDSFCNAPGYWTSDPVLSYWTWAMPITVRTLDCLKTSIPILEPEKILTLPNNGGTCAIRVKHLGEDLSDNSAVSYEIVDPMGSLNVEIGMDDNTASGCENNLKWQTTWQDPGIISQSYSVGASSRTRCALFIPGDYCATHQLAYGFEVSSPNCVIESYTSGQCTVGSGHGEGCGWGSSWTSPVQTTRVDARTVKAMASRGSSPSVSTDAFSSTFSFKQCTTNSHCTPGSGSANSDANPNTAKCNTGITSNFPQNTCIDSVAPTSSITNVRRITPDPKDLGAPGPNQWLQAGTYEVLVNDQDSGLLASDLQSCDYFVNDLGRLGLEKGGSRSCNTPLTITVGPTGDCRTERIGNCWVQISSKDRANNLSRVNTELSDKFLNIDYTAPSAQ